jgi:hypothetical protein
MMDEIDAIDIDKQALAMSHSKNDHNAISAIKGIIVL